MTSFRQSATSREPSLEGVDVHVHVLTTGFWPAYAPMEIRLPEVVRMHAHARRCAAPTHCLPACGQLARFQQIFQAFYLSKYSGRSLTWQHSLGQCVLKARFPKVCRCACARARSAAVVADRAASPLRRDGESCPSACSRLLCSCSSTPR